jgi:methyl-accepting chemotaxis protein
MLNAVWVAVIAAAFCWAVLVAAAVYVLVKLARLIHQTSAAVTGLRADSDAVIARAHATLDATAGQLNRTDEITASMDQVASNMAELTGRVTQFSPLAKLAAAQAGSRFARVSALVYGVRHAAELRAVSGSRALENGRRR